MKKATKRILAVLMGIMLVFFDRSLRRQAE